jgi:hypothetical protein
LNRRKITSELKRKYKRIEQFITDTDGKKESYSDLFCTKLGKKLGTNVDKVQEFSIKGILTIFPFESFVKGLKTLYQDERYLSSLEKPDAEDSHRIFELVKNDIIPQLDETVTGQIFNETDERVFLGALTTSLYSLLDAYTNDILTQIISLNGAAKRIVKNLASPLRFSMKETERILENPTKFYQSHVLQEAKKKGILTRLKLIKSGTGFWECIDTAIESTTLGGYEQNFRDFVNFRNLVAHGEPIPQINQFLQNELINSNITKMRDRFENALSDTDAPPAVLSELFYILLRWINERQAPIGIAFQLTSMALIFPALIDTGVDIMTNY